MSLKLINKIKLELNKKIKLLDNIDADKYISIFDEQYSKMLFLILSIVNDPETFEFSEVFQKDLSTYCDDLISITNMTRSYKINYIMIFFKMLLTTGFIKNNTISKASTSDALEKYDMIDYYFTLHSEISFTELWTVSSEKNKSYLVDILNNMYNNSINFIESEMKSRGLDLLWVDSNIPCKIFKTSMERDRHMMSTIIIDSINKNKYIKDDEYRKKVINVGNDIFERGIDALTDYKKSQNMNEMMKFIKRINYDVDNKKISQDEIVDVGISCIVKYKHHPAIISNPQFMGLLWMLTKGIKDKKNSTGGKISNKLERLNNILAIIIKSNVEIKKNKEFIAFIRQYNKMIKQSTKTKVGKVFRPH